MARKQKNVFLDLSQYNVESRLSSEVETIICQFLIYYSADINKVCRQTMLNDNIVMKIFMKYNAHISRIISSNATSDSITESLNNGADLIHGHIEELKSIKTNANVKRLTDSETSTLTRMLDRIVKIQEVQSKNFDSTVNQLSNNIVKQKTLEKLELGEIVDNAVEYSNSLAVVNALKTALIAKDNSMSPVKIKGTDIDTGEEIIFNSISEAEKYGYQKSKIHNCLSGVLKYYKNKVWTRIDMNIIEIIEKSEEDEYKKSNVE